MKVFKMPWKQETVNLDEVVLVPKIINYSREDYEFIDNDSENDLVVWKSFPRLTSIFEVYPDVDSFKRRAIPITVVRDIINLKSEPDSYMDFAVESLINKKDDTQDFSKGYIETLNFGE